MSDALELAERLERMSLADATAGIGAEAAAALRELQTELDNVRVDMRAVAAHLRDELTDARAESAHLREALGKRQALGHDTRCNALILDLDGFDKPTPARPCTCGFAEAAALLEKP